MHHMGASVTLWQMKPPAAEFLQMEVCHFTTIYNNMNVIGIASEAVCSYECTPGVVLEVVLQLKMLRL